ncbi:hypothetical protein [Nitrosopumilus sp.]|uniref:hypothetical protein n=1 Tax=Nitrosopumilus sp. TaxID=2024843 RepID=UPI00247C40B5|nr:hypothetical protein [Nitrosopumilus sp.]MCV0431839.1 hypothetical protein [Nitrosopumilus sp.]
MKTRYKILISTVIIITLLFVLAYPLFFGYFPFPWSNINDPYCHSYFQAYHDEPINSLALNFHIRNEIAKHGWEYNVPWRNIEIDSGAYSTGIGIDGSWTGKQTLAIINITESIVKFEGITSAEPSGMMCA